MSDNIVVAEKKKPVGFMAKTGALVAGAGALVATSATSSQAAIADLFSAIDITGAEAAVQAFIVSLVGIGLLFFGWKLLRRLGVSV